MNSIFNNLHFVPKPSILRQKFKVRFWFWWFSPIAALFKFKHYSGTFDTLIWTSPVCCKRAEQHMSKLQWKPYPVNVYTIPQHFKLDYVKCIIYFICNIPYFQKIERKRSKCHMISSPYTYPNKKSSRLLE